VIGALLAAAVLVAEPGYAQDKASEALKLKKPEMAQYQALTSLVDAVMSGKEQAPADVKVKFNHHLVKSTANVFVPYIVEISSGRLTSFPVAVYVRAVGRGTPTATDGAPKYAFTDVFFINDAKRLRSTGADTAEFSRGMELPAGEFDVYIAITEAAPRNRSAAPAKRAVHKEPVSIPSFATGFTTSSIILAKTLDEAPQQLTTEQQLEEPFTLGGYRVTPAFTPAFPTSAELLFVFFIYNAGSSSTGKPDVDVNYFFFRAAESKPFSKAATTALNATTLPAEFNASAGHQLVVGQGIPLASFAAGNYKLEIRITDKAANQSITRDVPFTVIP
jgi:hypothetical protein